MYSIAFPNMLSNSKVLLYKDKEASLSNLKLLIGSDKTALFGDPYYGTDLLQAIFEQNDSILADIVIDEIYTSILTFMPQISLTRDDITIEARNNKLVAVIKCINLLDYQPDLYVIDLITAENESTD